MPKETYQNGVRDTKLLSADEKIDMILDKLFLEKDCFRDRIVRVESGMIIIGAIAGGVVLPILVALLLKVFFHI